MVPIQRKHEGCQCNGNLGQEGLVLRYEQNLMLKQQLEENLQYILNRQSLEDVLDAYFACVGRILVHRPAEADSLFNLQMHHVVP